MKNSTPTRNAVAATGRKRTPMSRWQEGEPDKNNLEYEDRFLDEYLSRRMTSYSDFAEHRAPSAGLLPGSWQQPLCLHPPQPVLFSKDAGWTIFAGAGPDCTKQLGGFDLLLNLTGDTVFGGHIIPVPELKRWASPAGIPEIVLDWPDLGIVRLPREFWKALIALVAEQKAKMLVFCVGGHGRTGTAIASLMAACGWSSTEAIAWVRANYCGRAIETKEQEEYVRWIAGEIPSLGDGLSHTISASSR